MQCGRVGDHVQGHLQASLGLTSPGAFPTLALAATRSSWVPYSPAPGTQLFILPFVRSESSGDFVRNLSRKPGENKREK